MDQSGKIEAVGADRDFSMLENAYSFTQPPESYVRFFLTNIWFFYWFAAIFAVFISFVNLLIVASGRAPIHWIMQHGVAYLMLLLFGPMSLLRHSRPFSIALAVSCPFTMLLVGIDMVTVFKLCPTHWAAIALVNSFLLGGLIQLSIFLGAWSILKMNRQDAQLSAPTQRLKFYPRRALRTFTLIPDVLDFVKRRRIITATLILFGWAFVFVVPYNLSVSGEILVQDLSDLAKDCRASTDDDGSISACLEEGSKSLLLTYFSTTGIVIAVCLPLGHWLLRKGRRRITLALKDMTRSDTRAPILFLRPFEMDHLKLKKIPVWLLGKLIELGQPRKTLDEVVLEEGSPLGPVVAIGDPRDEFPPYGAARGYFDDKTWHDAVAELTSNAQFIVVCLGDTDGLRWELDHIAGNHYIERCLFLVPPEYSGPQDNQRIVTAALNRLGRCPDPTGTWLSTADSPNDRKPILGFFYQKDGLAIGRSEKFCTISFALMIRWFQRSRPEFMSQNAT